MIMTSTIQGFFLGLSLIFAIGSQNAFVLRQGLLGEHVFLLCMVCAGSDALLIVAGVSGFHLVVHQAPSLLWIARYGGAAFIAGYGISRFVSAIRGNAALDLAQTGQAGSRRASLLTCLAFTFLNPHVYLDTVLLLGSASAQFGDEAWRFAAGAVTASFVFFFSLGYGATLLRPLFANPLCWRWLDVLIGVTMLAIAANLVLSGFAVT